MVSFVIQSAGPCPFSGESRFVWVSRCGTWVCRRGNYGCMVLTHRATGKVHIVGGRMDSVDDRFTGWNTNPDATIPDVERFIEEMTPCHK